MGLTEASSSAICPARRSEPDPEPSSAYDIRGRNEDDMLRSERMEGVRDRVMNEMLGPEDSMVESRRRGTGMEG
jgi:hypothetical protein